jgi:hypothetical protein
MSNNLFRKGLVAATITGLAAAAFAGAPAYAATGDTVLLSSALGTSTNYNGLLSQQFSINALNSFTTSGHLWVKVSGAVAANVAVGRNDSSLPTTSLASTANAAAATTDTAVGNNNKLQNSYAGGNAPAHITGLVTAQKIDGSGAAASTDTAFAVDLGSASTNYSHLAFALRNITATTALTVTAWVDNGVANGVVDANEVAASQVINFVKDADVTATTTLTQPVIGETALKASVTLSNGINLAQAASGVTVDFAKNGASSAAAAPATQTTTYDSTDAVLVANPTGLTTAVAAATFSAQANVNGTASGTADLRTVVAAVVNAAGKLVPAAGANVVNAGSTNSGNTWYVRSGTTSVVLTNTLKDSAAAAVPAGKLVSVTVTPTALDATSVISAGGKTGTAGSLTALTFTTTTDANGAISVTLGNTVAKNLDAVTVALTAEGVPGTTQTISWADAAYSLAANTTGRSVVIGGTYTGTWKVADQFGIAPADGKYVVQVSRPANSGRSTVLYTVNQPVVAGVATVALADAGTIAGSDSISAGLYPVLAGGANGTQVGSNTSFTLTYASAASVTPTAVTASVDNDGTTTAQLLNLVAPVATDTSLPNAPAAADYTASTGRTLTFSVQQATGANISGTPVTVSAPGLAFVSGTKHTIGSYTTTTTGSSQTVTVYSTLAGKQTITVTAGSVSKTVSITFAAAGATKGANLVVAAPATAKPGSTVAVTATLTDAFGNPVATTANFKLSTSGVGGATAVTATGADGVATAYVNLGASDLGTVTVTATYTDGATTPVTTTKTASIVVAAASAAKTAVAVGADQAQVGAAVDVIATATDAAGKAAAGVVVTFDNVGSGYLSATTATTDANGVAKVKLVGNVAGRNTLTATANGATAANAGVSFGAADANITVKGKRATVTYEFAGLAKVVVSVNGTRQPAVYPADDNEGTYSFNLKAGTSKIVVSIAGKTVDSKTVKIKK